MKKARNGASVSLLPGFIFYSSCCSPQLFFSSQVARLLFVEGAMVMLSPPVRVGDLARRSGLSLRRCSEFSLSILVIVVVGVMMRWSNREEVIISITILQMCATLQLCSPLLFVVIMTIVVVNNEKKRKLISHHHHYHDNNIQISCSSSSDVCAST